MRLALIAALPFAALLTGGAAPERLRLPFDGTWMHCETYRGASICAYKVMAQRGTRVCGVQRDFATNAYYTQRFVATADKSTARIDKICGDPGSETDTYCAGQAPTPGAKSGWGPSDRTLHSCGNGLFSAESGTPFTCAGARPETGLPRVGSLKDEGPDSDDAAWIASCIKGAEG